MVAFLPDKLFEMYDKGFVACVFWDKARVTSLPPHHTMWSPMPHLIPGPVVAQVISGASPWHLTQDPEGRCWKNRESSHLLVTAGGGHSQGSPVHWLSLKFASAWLGLEACA